MANFKVKNLSVSYQQKKLFENLTFEIGFPAFVAIVGGNGSGKTSFFKALLKNIDSEGVVCFKGAFLSKSIIASLPQHNTLNFDIKAIEVVVMGLFSTKGKFQNYNKKDYAKARDVMAKLGVDAFAERNFQTLSGGEQQLIWLAQLILQDKDVWLLDEPLQQLDVKNKVRVTQLLEEYAYEKGKLIFCITHDLQLLHQSKGWLLNFSKIEQGVIPINTINVEKQLALLSV